MSVELMPSDGHYRSRLGEAELATQVDLSDHLIGRAIDAYERGESDDFWYSTEIYEETRGRIIVINFARQMVDRAFEEYANRSHLWAYEGLHDELMSDPLGAVALASLILTGEL